MSLGLFSRRLGRKQGVEQEQVSQVKIPRLGAGEIEVLRRQQGVGPTVIKRFEELGIDSLAQLATYRAEDIAEMVAAMLGSTCWKNSPQAKAALNAAIARAKESQ